MTIRFAVACFAFVATAPLVLAYCTKPADTPIAQDASIAADPSAPASSAGMTAPPTPAMITASVASSSSSPQPSKSQACETLRVKISTLIASGRACSADADCDHVYTGCGLDGMCGAAIAKAHIAEVQKVSSLFFSKACPAALPPMPCATCAMPPAARCVNGQCN